jgi:ribokinase
VTIHVLGNCTIDVSFEVERFPMPGETIIARSRRVDVGGKGVNQAVVASRFGIPVRLTAPVGTDAEGDFAMRVLSEEALDLAGIIRLPGASDQSIIYVAADGENTIVSSAAAADALTPAAAVAALASARASEWLMMQGNLSFETTMAAMEAARARRVRTILNPAPIRWPAHRLWPLCDIAVLNRVEAAALLGTGVPAEALAQLLAAGVGLAAITLGAEGAVFARDGSPVHVPAEPVRSVDTAGAGDTFCGALAAGLHRGLDPADAFRLASRAAALAVTRPGTHGSFPAANEAAGLLAEIRR